MFVGAMSAPINHPEVTVGSDLSTETLGKMQGYPRYDSLWYELFLPERACNIRTGLWQPSVHSDVAF
jgi:hypothetical protein